MERFFKLILVLATSYQLTLLKISPNSFTFKPKQPFHAHTHMFLHKIDVWYDRVSGFLVSSLHTDFPGELESVQYDEL